MNNNKNKYKIGVLVGSLRRGSYSKALANTLFELAPENLELKHIEIGDLPYYNDDLDGDTAPQSWTRLRTEIIGCDGFIFVTPEYNRSIPAALKNALDVGSHPYGQNRWAGKTGGIVCCTIGSLGGLAAGVALRQPMACLNIPLLQHPEVYISHVDQLFDENGKLTDESTKEFLKSFMDEFAKFTAAIAAIK